MAAAAALLGWLAAHAAILFPDGLRYIGQARRIADGSWREGLVGSVDHPVYPLAIAAAHGLVGGESPEAWQAAAQLASVLAGVLLVIPLYLVADGLFGARVAWLGCALVYAVPLVPHVLADVLSEGTFLLFWTWGLWTTLRFLEEGRFLWLPPTIAFGALAYLSRPEGLLLPAALVAALALMPLLRSTRLNWPRWWAAVAFLVLGPGLLVGPYIATKGGVGTKPAIQRLLGTAPKSAADAVERKRPLDPGQSTAKTYLLASKAMAEAVREAVTLPMLVLAAVGVAAGRPRSRSRVWLFLGIVIVAALLALIRLHATGGYCSGRHAMVLALILIPAAARGLDTILGALAIPGRWLGLGEGRFTAGPAVWALVLLALVGRSGKDVLAPINGEYVGYRGAAAYLREHVPAGARVVDVTGWSLYYGERSGYTYANLIEAPADPDLRWVVVRDGHLRGPWPYCARLRALVAGHEPVAVYPERPRPDEAQVFVFDLKAATPVGAVGRRPSPAHVR
jgi:hypothetical protein